jgi:hypothetical protein
VSGRCAFRQLPPIYVGIRFISHCVVFMFVVNRYMAVCNDFLRANSAKMQALIRNLSTVDSKEAAVAAAAAATGAEAPGAAQYALANISQLASTRRKPLEKIKSPVSKALLKALAGIDGRSKV